MESEACAHSCDHAPQLLRDDEILQPEEGWLLAKGVPKDFG